MAAIPSPTVDSSHPYPTGWFAIRASEEIPSGGVDPVEALGREFVVYRGEDGDAHVLDAHCRHLGAHMGYGGKVEGCALRCPFHGWRWEPDGRCSDVPYATAQPRGARIDTWAVAERNGFVYLWNAPSSEPEYPLPEAAALTGSATDWQPVARERWRVAAPLDLIRRTAPVHSALQFVVGADHLDAFENERGDGWTRYESPLHEGGAIASWIMGAGATEIHHVRGEAETLSVLNYTPIDSLRVDIRGAFWCRPGHGDAASRFTTEIGERFSGRLALLEAAGLSGADATGAG